MNRIYKEIENVIEMYKYGLISESECNSMVRSLEFQLMACDYL